MNRMYQILAAFCWLILSGCATKITTPTTHVYDSMDEFLAELAGRAKAKIAPNDDFQIVVTQAYYPIGTLMRTGSTIPIDYAACVPVAAETPPKALTPNLFPAYSLSKSLAVDFGLDNVAVKELADVGMTLKDKDKISLTVKSPKLQVIADNPLTALLKRPDCRGAVPSSTAWLVRGYIIGQRTFTLDDEKAGILKGKILKVASLNLSHEGAESVSMTDETDVGFLQIVSQVTPTPLATAPILVTKPSVVINGAGRVYVQRDKLDSSGNANLLVTSLKASSFNVETAVEPIESKRMPRLAEVRYFNEGDQSKAEGAALILRQKFPDAIIRRVALPAPVGQLEVWLPRIRT